MSTIGNKRPGGSLVYSTESGRMCPACSRPIAQCSCSQAQAAIPDPRSVVRVSLETKGRRGKGVTVIKGVPLDALALAELGKQLRTACGSGGTVKDGTIEIQGDHRELALQRLMARGWTVKRADG